MSVEIVRVLSGNINLSFSARRTISVPSIKLYISGSGRSYRVADWPLGSKYASRSKIDN